LRLIRADTDRRREIAAGASKEQVLERRGLADDSERAMVGIELFCGPKGDGDPLDPPVGMLDREGDRLARILAQVVEHVRLAEEIVLATVHAEDGVARLEPGGSGR